MTDPFIPQQKLFWHLDRLFQILHDGHTIAPITVEFYPTYKCNLGCKFCDFAHVNKKNKDMSLPKELGDKIIEQLSEAGVRGINWSGGGEPTLHPDLPHWAELISETGMTQGIFTNGLLMNEGLIKTFLEHMSWVRFSVNAGTPTAYANIHGTDKNVFHNVLKNIGKLVDMKKEGGHKTTIGVSMVANRENCLEVGGLGHIIDGLGVDYFQVRPDSSMIPGIAQCVYEDMMNMLKADPISHRFLISKYKWADVQKNNCDKYYDMCRAPWLIGVIGAEGKMWICSEMVGREGMAIGDLNAETFRDIWERERLANILKYITPSHCRNLCKDHEVNKLLYHIFKVDEGKHPNHI